MRDEATPGPLTQASAPLSGSPRNRQIPWGGTAPGRLGQRRCKELPVLDTLTSLPGSVRLVGRADLLGQLVPAHAVAHLGPQLPLQRLRLRLDGRPQFVQPRTNQGAVDV